MDELDIADMEVIDIFDGNELSDDEKNDSHSNLFQEYRTNIKSSHFYKLYQNCPDRMATPDPPENLYTSLLTHEHLRKYPRLQKWANKVKNYACSEKTLLSKEDVRLLLEDMKSGKHSSFNNFSKRYSYYNEIHPKGHPKRRVTTPEPTMYVENRIEYVHICWQNRPWSRVIVYSSNLPFCQNNTTMQRWERKACYNIL